MGSDITEIIASHKTLREKIAELLREAIIQQKLKPGERVTELEIASRFGLSRTPIREAFRQLESEGFLHIVPRKGAMVAELDEKDIRDFYEIKAVLEGYAARVAAERVTADDIDRLEKLNRRMRACAGKHDIAGMTVAHNEFHQVILEICGNQKIIEVVGNLVRQFLRFRFFVSASAELERLLAHHDLVIEALRTRDGQAAERYIVQNARLGEQVLVDFFLSRKGSEQGDKR
ncbi:MAG: GntR family transcriptional regulator [Deltaproteobacteria bacterium]|nr:GntR family transcriptional regulator [Candidatus Anaeroferrophillacea bacterium]